MSNIDPDTVEGFGEEWSRFDQSGLSKAELGEWGDRYFSILPLASLNKSMKAMDVGCGSGRWSTLVAPLVGEIHLVDPSGQALEVAKRNLGRFPNAIFHKASVDQLPVRDGSMDLIFSLGVFHHVPDVSAAVRNCVEKLAPGGKLLLYLYYRLEFRSRWFYLLWKVSDLVRKLISRLPFTARKRVADCIAVLVYWPISRISLIASFIGINVSTFPLSIYRRSSLYLLRTDALDRFGTKLENRFSRAEIEKILFEAGLEEITFRESEPFWCVLGRKPTGPDQVVIS